MNATDPYGLWQLLNPTTWFDGNTYEGTGAEYFEGQDFADSFISFGEGAESYWSDLGAGTYQATALNGVFGSEEQQIAEETLAIVSNGLNAAAKCPELVGEAALKYAKSNPERIMGRTASGLLMSLGLGVTARHTPAPAAGSVLSLSLTGLAAYGSMSNLATSGRQYAPESLVNAAIGGYIPQ